jgi:WD40 repeat protein
MGEGDISMELKRDTQFDTISSSEVVSSEDYHQVNNTLPASAVSRRSVVMGLSGLLATSAGVASLENFMTTHSETNTQSPPNIQHVSDPPLLTVKEAFGAKWSPNGQYLASAGNNVQVWDITTTKNILTYNGHSDEVLAVSWSPDSKYLASASFDHSVHILNIETKESALIYRGHSNWVRDVAWSPDGMRIASAGYDNTLQLWHPFTGQKLSTYVNHSDGIISLAWSPDGVHIASLDFNNVMKIW